MRVIVLWRLSQQDNLADKILVDIPDKELQGLELIDVIYAIENYIIMKTALSRDQFLWTDENSKYVSQV